MLLRKSWYKAPYNKPQEESVQNIKNI